MGYLELPELWKIENPDFANDRLQLLEHVSKADTDKLFLGTKVKVSIDNGIETARLVFGLEGRLTPNELKLIKRRAMYSIHQDLVSLGEIDAANNIIDSSQG